MSDDAMISEAKRDKVRDAIAEALGQSAYMRITDLFCQWRFERKHDRTQRARKADRKRRLDRMAALEDELRDLECAEAAALAFETKQPVTLTRSPQ